MIICFECSEENKRGIDQLIAAGRYRDYSEFVSVAVANQLVHEQAAGSQAVRGKSSKSADASQRDANPSRGDESPSVFSVPKGTAKAPFAAAPDDVFIVADGVPPDRWIFGQYNRLLPIKASCRAIANLMELQVEGIELETSAVEIARAARSLGIALHARDVEESVERDDQLSVAFPLLPNAEKGIARFANQFVGAMNTRGQLSGLPAALKLIGRVDSSRKQQRVALTEAGWRFANLKSPSIDGKTAQKLSPEERRFLCKHILKNVPQEATAFQTLLELINGEENTPEKLDKALRKRVSMGFEGTDAFLASQRSGAISRMSDLELVSRRREATRVTYVVTDFGALFAKGRIDE
jgi:Arc/MetJ-type ribon-helix-helix transcriptional regulator